MFNLLICSPFLVLLPFWGRFNTRSIYFLNVIIVIFLAVMFTSFYLNGEDWANYYVNFFTGQSSSWFEPGFYLFFKILSLITFGSFGTTIFLFYFIAFSLIIIFLNKINSVNVPFFIVLLVMCFGNTLILEQLRQFYSAIFGMYALFYYLKKDELGRNKYILFLCLALCFHISAIILCFSFFISKLKSTKLFVMVSFLGIAIILTVLTAPFIIEPVIIFFPQLALKLMQYLDITSLGLHYGPSLFFSFGALIYFLINLRIISPSGNQNWLMFRQLFLGVLIFMVGLYVPFASRFSVFYITYLFLFVSLIKSTTHCIAYVQLSKLYLVVVIVLFITSNNFSYYRNDIAPITFNQLTLRFSVFLNDELDYDKLVSEIYLKNYQNLNEYLKAQGK